MNVKFTWLDLTVEVNPSERVSLYWLVVIQNAGETPLIKSLFVDWVAGWRYRCFWQQSK